MDCPFLFLFEFFMTTSCSKILRMIPSSPFDSWRRRHIESDRRVSVGIWAYVDESRETTTSCCCCCCSTWYCSGELGKHFVLEVQLPIVYIWLRPAVPLFLDQSKPSLIPMTTSTSTSTTRAWRSLSTPIQQEDFFHFPDQPNAIQDTPEFLFSWNQGPPC